MYAPLKKALFGSHLHFYNHWMQDKKERSMGRELTEKIVFN